MTMHAKPAQARPDNLGMLIGLVRSEIVRLLESELARTGVDVSFTQFLILKRLNSLGPVNAGELARAVDLDAGAMTRQLDQLERKGYLIRQPHEQDRRALRIELTKAGKALCGEMNTCNARTLEAAQRALNAHERAQLHDYLERVLHTLREKD